MNKLCIYSSWVQLAKLIFQEVSVLLHLEEAPGALLRQTCQSSFYNFPAAYGSAHTDLFPCHYQCWHESSDYHQNTLSKDFRVKNCVSVLLGTSHMQPLGGQSLITECSRSSAFSSDGGLLLLMDALQCLLQSWGVQLPSATRTLTKTHLAITQLPRGKVILHVSDQR